MSNLIVRIPEKGERGAIYNPQTSQIATIEYLAEGQFKQAWMDVGESTVYLGIDASCPDASIEAFAYICAQSGLNPNPHLPCAEYLGQAVREAKRQFVPVKKLPTFKMDVYRMPLFNVPFTPDRKTEIGIISHYQALFLNRLSWDRTVSQVGETLNFLLEFSDVFEEFQMEHDLFGPNLSQSDKSDLEDTFQDFLRAWIDTIRASQPQPPPPPPKLASELDNFKDEFLAAYQGGGRWSPDIGGVTPYQIITQDLADAYSSFAHYMEDVYDDGRGWPSGIDDWRMEYPARNLGTDDQGRLVLMDVFFSSQVCHTATRTRGEDLGIPFYSTPRNLKRDVTNNDAWIKIDTPPEIETPERPQGWSDQSTKIATPSQTGTPEPRFKIGDQVRALFRPLRTGAVEPIEGTVVEVDRIGRLFAYVVVTAEGDRRAIWEEDIQGGWRGMGEEFTQEAVRVESDTSRPLFDTPAPTSVQGAWLDYIEQVRSLITSYYDSDLFAIRQQIFNLVYNFGFNAFSLREWSSWKSKIEREREMLALTDDKSWEVTFILPRFHFTPWGAGELMGEDLEKLPQFQTLTDGPDLQLINYWLTFNQAIEQVYEVAVEGGAKAALQRLRDGIFDLQEWLFHIEGGGVGWRWEVNPRVDTHDRHNLDVGMGVGFFEVESLRIGHSPIWPFDLLNRNEPTTTAELDWKERIDSSFFARPFWEGEAGGRKRLVDNPRRYHYLPLKHRRLLPPSYSDQYQFEFFTFKGTR